MTIKGILFDLYGTLVDIETDESKDEIYRTIAHYLTYHGVYLHGDEVRERYYQIMRQQREASGEEYTEIDVEAIWNQLLLQEGIRFLPIRGQLAKVLSTGLPCRIAQPAATIPGRKRGVEHVKDQLWAGGIGNGCPILLRYSRNPRRGAGFLLQACHHLKPLWLQKT